MVQALTPPAVEHESHLCWRGKETALCVYILLCHSSLTVISVTLFTLRSGGATWGLLAAVFTACWLDTAVRGVVWRETVEWHSVKHRHSAQSLNVLMAAVCLKEYKHSISVIPVRPGCHAELVSTMQESVMSSICVPNRISPLHHPIKTQFALCFISVRPHLLWAVTNSCVSITLHLHVHTAWAQTNSCTEHWHLMDRLKWLFWPEIYIMRQFWHMEGVTLIMLWLWLPGNISIFGNSAWILPWEGLHVISVMVSCI